MAVKVIRKLLIFVFVRFTMLVAPHGLYTILTVLREVFVIVKHILPSVLLPVNESPSLFLSFSSFLFTSHLSLPQYDTVCCSNIRTSGFV